ncbi:high-potential iron-sulfur protein [Paraburkholderia sp. BL21I4N1]|uniref:high-potential iron-sulfur protein n=1 Tax=Paraburkholderia sp. BL21I4N1 TaxID=1938801 RepID=UPI000CFAB0DF|nr:high-potential iron-sulfur protein [Paraburkholderia sp. BL21I4N1]PQV44175.1 high potential iron-sulfur protein [Paraburkholderia sp. BL21I4N1]
MHISRRRFMITAASLASATLLSDESRADVTAVSETDPTAEALGYKRDATRVDKAKYPKYVAGQACVNCQLYQGKPGASTGPCPIYGGKLVDSRGWCSAYVKKN